MASLDRSNLKPRLKIFWRVSLHVEVHRRPLGEQVGGVGLDGVVVHLDVVLQGRELNRFHFVIPAGWSGVGVGLVQQRLILTLS